jgi:S-adenosylmethionine:tRNA ribosyltransferase-isomerase
MSAPCDAFESADTSDTTDAADAVSGPVSGSVSGSADATYRSPRPASGLDMRDFDYELPDAAIAQHPVEPRDAARLLDATGEAVVHRRVAELASVLSPGDLLVCNDTRVIPARLALRKDSGGAVEVLLVDRLDAHVANDRQWAALVRPSKRVREGTVLMAGPGLLIEIGAVLDGGRRRVRLLDDAGMVHDAEGEHDALERYGVPPLPPYITAPLADASRYQTTFARAGESAAAPTAGLHLTDAVFASLAASGVTRATVELTVGLDTFKPVTVDRPEDHPMHSERYRVPIETVAAIERTRAAGGRVLAVGTTTVRTLETYAASGRREGRTELFIYGSYPFQVVDLLLTNFHLPRTSLLLMIEAFAGPRWRDLYAEALTSGYRFLSFGDAMLLRRR